MLPAQAIKKESFRDKIRRLLKRKGPDSGDPNNNKSGASGAQQVLKDDAAPAAAQSSTTTTPVVANKAVANKALVAATSSGQLEVLLKNDTTSSNVFAYITGQAIDHNNAVFLLSSDARTPYYPASPSATGASLAQNVSISLGAPGNVIIAVIPRLAGARIWFSIGTPLVFKLNPGPGLVEPSVFNAADPNINTNFGFMEFTFNSAQLFANISYVDFVGTPISLSINDTTGRGQHVSGIRANSIDAIASGLQAQSAKDGARWNSLIVTNNGKNLRVLSPNSGITLNPTFFQTYWSAYIDQVWQKYTTDTLTINTQASFGNMTGKVNASGLLDFGNGITFAKPSARDIFSCSTGPFATGSNAAKNAIIPRLSAAINRTTLLRASSQPNGANPSMYYTYGTTNHYARVVHAANVDGFGYTFPYDDVVPDGGVGQEGALSSGIPQSMTVTVGGVHASSEVWG